MKLLLTTLTFLFSLNAFSYEYNFWEGSGVLVETENDKVVLKEDCNETIGFSTTQGPQLVIAGGLCNNLEISVVLKNKSGNLILTKQDSIGVGGWTSPDLGKTVGKLKGKSFTYKFSGKNADGLVFVLEGKLEVDQNGKSGVFSFSELYLFNNERRYKTEVSGNVSALEF